MQNKSPLQVKSVPSVCSRLPSSSGNEAQALGPRSPALASSVMCIHKFIPSPASGPAPLAPVGPVPTQPSFCVTLQSIRPASQIRRKPALSAAPVLAVPPGLVRLQPVDSLCAPPVHLPNPCPLAPIAALPLSAPSVSIWYTTFLGLRSRVSKMGVIRALISEYLRET